MKQYRYYLFDMGSTLLEFHNPDWDEQAIAIKGHNRMLDHISNSYGKSIADIIDKDVISPWYDYVKHERKVKRIEYRICEALFLKFAALEIPISYKEIIEIIKKEYFDFYTYAHPNEGVLDCLKTLKGRDCKIGVVSNSMYPKEIHLAIFKRECLDSFIDSYSFSYENTYMKPHPSIFVRAMMSLQAKMSETIMVGDNEYVDFYINNFMEIIL